MKQSGEALSLSSKAREADRVKMQELRDQVASLSVLVGDLGTRLDTMSTWAIAVHILFLLFEILIGVMFIMACCNGRLRRQYQPVQQQAAVQLSDQARVNQSTQHKSIAIDAEEHEVLSSTPAKRRHSLEEEASFVLDQDRVQEVTLSKRRSSLDRESIYLLTTIHQSILYHLLFQSMQRARKFPTGIYHRARWKG